MATQIAGFAVGSVLTVSGKLLFRIEKPATRGQWLVALTPTFVGALLGIIVLWQNSAMGYLPLALLLGGTVAVMLVGHRRSVTQ